MDPDVLPGGLYVHETQSPGVSNMELSDILRLTDNSIDQSHSISFDLNAVFQQNDSFLAADEDVHRDGSLISQHAPVDTASGLYSQEPESLGKSSKLSRNATNSLRLWFENHADRPYPNKEEKKSLASQTGLKVHQVSTWFANARRRRNQNAPVGNAPLDPDCLDSLDGFQGSTHQQPPAVSPLDR